MTHLFKSREPAALTNESSPVVRSVQPSATNPCDQPEPHHLAGGVWTKDTHFNIQGGQAMTFHLKNLNILGTDITISAGSFGRVILLPTGTIEFTVFGAEPMGWSFDVSFNSDAHTVGWQLDIGFLVVHQIVSQQLRTKIAYTIFLSAKML